MNGSLRGEIHNENLCERTFAFRISHYGFLASVGHDVVGLDDYLNNINNLNQGKASLYATIAA